MNSEEVIAKAREAMMQLITDPENQPSQFGTVMVEYMQREIEAEREACAKVCDEIVARYRHADDAPEMVAANWCADGVRARGSV